MALTNILFICVGNSCRSQMAEAFANNLGQGRLRAWSAGIYPLGWIEPSTRIVMDEKDVSLAGQSSKGIPDVPLDQMDVVVAMGPEVFLDPSACERGRLIRWEIPDPFSSSLGRYRAVRDLIEVQVRNLVVELTFE